jgi:hypothetical protein
MAFDSSYNYHLLKETMNYAQTVQKKQQMDVGPTGRQ